MQAHPLSIPAARIPSTSPPAQNPQAYPAVGISPHLSLASPSRVSSGLYVGVTSSLAADLRSAFAVAEPPKSTHKTASLAEGAGLAHDAGNLLGALGLYCDLLQAPGVLRPEHQHYADELRKLTERSGAMIQRLLQANLPQASQQATTSCDPAAVLHELEPILACIAAPSSTLRVEAEAGLTDSPVPAETLERIALNLVRNAAQAIQRSHDDAQPNKVRQGNIVVTMRQVKQNLELCVEDNGPGLKPGMAAAFLHPAPLPTGAQHGLGHRIVHELVKKSGGRMTVRVRPGRGTTFVLAWPLAPRSEAQARVGLEASSYPMSDFGCGGSSAC